MDKKNIIWPSWRLKLLGRLDTTLILFELILSVIFISVGYLAGSAYFRGVGVGLVIAWVTSALALFIKKEKIKTMSNEERAAFAPAA